MRVCSLGTRSTKYQHNNNIMAMGSASSSAGTTVLTYSCSRCAALTQLTDDASATTVHNTAASNMSYFSTRWYCYYWSEYPADYAI